MANLKYDPVPHNQKAFLEKASKRRGFREAYDALETEYALAHEMLTARTRAGLTQEAVADRMGTTKSAVSRLEGAGKHAPSMASLRKYAAAVGCILKIEFIPQPAKRGSPAQPMVQADTPKTIPNVTTLAAMHEARSMRRAGFNSAQALFDNLDKNRKTKARKTAAK